VAEFQAGEVVVPVVPDATGFHKELKKSLVPGAYKVGQDIGKEIGRGISDSLKGVYEPLREETQRQKQRAPQDGAAVGGAFARGVKSAMEAAFKSLPKIELDAESTEAQRKIQDLRTRIETLSGKTVGIDIDAATAQAEVVALQRELEALDGQDVSVDVRADIAAALAQLAAAESALSGLDKQVARPKVDVDIAGAMAAIGTITAALGALAAIPVGASLAAGVGALTAPLAAAGAGFAGLAAVAGPSIGRINEALKEQEKATQAASGATRSATQVAAQQAQQAFSLEQAERRIVEAKKTAQSAEEELTRARQDARRAVEELRLAVQDAALSEESAALSVEEARQRLAEVEADPKATDLQRRRAELSVRQAEQAHQRAIARSKELKSEQKAADKAGIEGSEQVKAAKDRLAQAEQRVKDAQTQLKILQLQQATASAQQAKAAGAVASRFRELSPAAQKAAGQIKAFQDAYLGWQKQLEPAVLPAVTGGLKVLQALFKPLTPLVKGTAGALVGLEKSAAKALGGPFWTDFFAQLSKEAPGAITNLVKSIGHVITGVAGIIRAFLPFSGSVTGGIEGAAKAFADWGKSLKDSEGFKAFISYVQTNGPKIWQIVKNIGQVIANLFSGVDVAGAGAGVLDTLVSLSGWLASLSPGTLQAFAAAALAVVAAFKTWKIISTAVDGVVKSVQTARTIWSGISTAASVAAKGVKLAASGITAAARGIGKGVGKAGTAVWSGIQTAASKAAQVAKTSGQAIANAAKTAGSAAARGGAAAWDGIRTAAQRAGSAAKTAAGAIVTAGRTAAVAALSLGKVALGYTRIAAQAAIARTRQLAYAAATAIVRGATVAWTAVQWLLNAALNANPIGVIVLAIAALVAGLIWAWNNSETFRNIVTAAWEAIKTAIQFAWENVIKPVFDAVWGFIRDVLGPVFEWLWNEVIVPAWQGIQTAIQTAWNSVIQPALQAIWNFIKNTLGPIFNWIWKNIIVPAWQGIQTSIKVAWENVIKPALQAVWGFIKNTLGPVFTWIWKNVIVPAWEGIKTSITTVWEKFLKPVFDKLHDVIFKTIPDAFKKGVEFIKTAWDKVKEVAKAPVKFIVDVVYNNGIVKVWNAVADFLKLPKLSPLAFAKGGVMPGYTPGKDVALAAVSGGEAIMRPEWTRAVGEDYVHRMNSAARKGGVAGVARALGVAGDPGFAGAFAEGGIVGDLKDLVSTGIKIGAEKLLNPLLDSAARAMGDAPWAKMLTNIPKQMISGVIKFLGDKEGSAGGGRAVQYARQQLGKPYVWGGTGPDGFDCSGLTSQAWKHAGVADIPRVSQDQMKWVKPVSTPLPGDLGFPHSGHVWMYSGGGKIIEAPYTGANVREVAARAAELIGRPPQLLASGGIVRYARGGVRPKAHITDQPTVLYGEAGPEAFIPLGGGMRRRGLEVLGQAAAAMGQIVLPTSALAGGGYLEALQSAALMATGGIIPPTGSGSAGSAAVGQVAGVVSRSSSSISTTMLKSSQVLKQALATGTTTLSGAVGDAWQRASAGLTTTSTTLSQAATKAATTTSTSINQVAEAEIAASSKLVTATTDLGTTVSKATGELKATLVQVASSATKGATATAAKPATPEAPGAPAAAKAAKGVKNTVAGTTSGIAQLILFEDQDIPSRVGPTSYDAGGMLVPGTSLVHNGTGRPERVLTDRQWQDIQGGGSGGGPLLQIDEFNATPEQSPRAIAGELKHLLGSQLRMR
jgi:chemotaxis protein histidine kinase CheA